MSNQWVALLRGINVGGKNRLKMADLCGYCSALGFSDVCSYIQSGNVVFGGEIEDPDEITAALADAIYSAHQFRPAITLVSAGDWSRLVNALPFSSTDLKTIHLFVTASEPASENIAQAMQLLVDDEAAHFTEGGFYLSTPAGIGRSNFARRVERTLGVSVTARNWRSVTQISKLLETIEG